MFGCFSSSALISDGSSCSFDELNFSVVSVQPGQ